MAVTLAQAREAKDAAKNELASLPGVTGVGISKIGDDYVLKVNLREPLPAGVVAPAQIAGVAVHCEVIGRVTKRRRGDDSKG
jgi:hypothetical protein